MKHRALLLLCPLALSCAQYPPPRPSPADRFYFPTSLSFFLPPGSTSGILYVASSNYDRRYDQGNLIAVNLDRILSPAVDGGPGQLSGLPPPGFTVEDTAPAYQFTDLATDAGDVVQIQSFAAEMVRDPVGYGGRPRLWVATRAESDLLEPVSTDPSGEGLLCVPPGRVNNCVFSGISVAVEQEPQGGTGQPAAPQPYGLGLSTEDSIVPGELWVSHIRPADSPPTSGLDLINYVVHLDARAFIPVVNVPNAFVPIGLGAGNSVFVGHTNVYVSGRGQLTQTALDVLLRLVDRYNLQTFFPQLALQYANSQARGLAVRADESRIYLVGNLPDTLLVVDVAQPFSQYPILTVVRAIPLPGGPNAIRLIERPGAGDVLAITCQNDGTVAIYDDDIGQLATIINGVGIAPYDVVVDQRGDAARLFVSNFDDGRVAVIDMLLGGPGQPLLARITAFLGQQQGCILQTDDSNCVGSQ